MIKDSGERREFESGAVRDIQEGKGRCDLMPLDVVAELLDDDVLRCIATFRETGEFPCLFNALRIFISKRWFVENYAPMANAMLEVAKHFEEGALKYGEDNWRLGLPIHCYIDSAVRHYLKWLRGDDDERHDRAFVWNLTCCLWTCKHKPELDDFSCSVIPIDSVDVGSIYQKKKEIGENNGNTGRNTEA